MRARDPKGLCGPVAMQQWLQCCEETSDTLSHPRNFWRGRVRRRHFIKALSGAVRLVVRVPLAILGRPHPNMADEGATQRDGIGKAAFFGASRPSSKRAPRPPKRTCSIMRVRR